LRNYFRGRSVWTAGAALRWRLSTAIQKRFILLQDRFGWYGYQDWIRENEGEVQPIAGLKIHAEGLAYRPLVSLLIPWEGPSLDGLSSLIKILAGQWYENWEGCLLLGSNLGEGGFEAASRVAQGEPRMRLKKADSTSISKVLSLQALEMASGEFVLLLEGGDILSPQLLSEMALRLNETPTPDILYTDEDYLSADGKLRLDPFFKPDWSPELLISTNYLRHALFRASLMKEAAEQIPSREAGGYDELIFRCAEAAQGIGHLPKVLYHNRGGVSSDLQQARLKSIEGHLRRTGVSGAQAALLKDSQVKVTWPVQNQKVSIIIPTRDHVETLAKCIQTLRERTSYPNYELILVDNGSCEGSTHEYYAQIRKDPDLRILDYREPFNYSAANNLGARNAAGEIYLFLNNDTEIIEPEWLEELVRWAERPEIGAVGARLLYPDGSIQHTGIVVGMEGHGSHVFTGANPQRAIFGSIDWYRNTSAVTGACMAVRREVFIQAGGFDEDYELVFNDIEFCLRVMGLGYRNMVTPYARLIHHEGKTRFRYIPTRDIQLGYVHLKDWVARGDPYYNPNLSYAVRTPTFRRRFEESPIERLEAIVKYS
jgi:GT2 family glycosyltransferase